VGRVVLLMIGPELEVTVTDDTVGDRYGLEVVVPAADPFGDGL